MRQRFVLGLIRAPHDPSLTPGASSEQPFMDVFVALGEWPVLAVMESFP